MTTNTNTDWTDDRPQQDTLAGVADATQHREAKALEGSAAFADDRGRDGADDAGEQASIAPDADDNQETLAGDRGAETPPEWS